MARCEVQRVGESVLLGVVDPSTGELVEVLLADGTAIHLGEALIAATRPTARDTLDADLRYLLGLA